VLPVADVQVGDVTVRLDKGLIKGKEGGGGVKVSAFSSGGFQIKGGATFNPKISSWLSVSHGRSPMGT